jgi:peptide methionine sulfoxide reductase msrA/msrB
MKVQKVYFAAGYFWGVQHYLCKAKGVAETTVGYMGGKTDNPTYKEVCTNTTGHAEVVEVVYDPLQISFEELAKLFFEVHDPTQVNRQGPNIGEQYRSEIFYTSEEEKKTAEKLIQILSTKGIVAVTELEPATTFWKAEDYHQHYYDKNGKTPFCHAYTKRF